MKTNDLMRVVEQDCQGRCAKCGGDELEYGGRKVDGQELWYEYECEDCGDTGNEYYTLKYDCSISHKDNN